MRRAKISYHHRSNRTQGTTPEIRMNGEGKGKKIHFLFCVQVPLLQRLDQFNFKERSLGRTSPACSPGNLRRPRDRSGHRFAHSFFSAAFSHPLMTEWGQGLPPLNYTLARIPAYSNPDLFHVKPRVHHL